MAVESDVMFRRVARGACLVFMAGLLPGSAAMAQLPIKAPAPVTAGSVIPFSHGSTGAWSQIYSMKIDPMHHNILFLDSALSELFQLSPNASAPALIAGPAPATGNSDCSDLEKSGSYWNAAIAFDQWDNLYVTDRYGSAVQFCRVPYNASAGTWSFSNADNWPGPTYKNSAGNAVAIPPQDLQVGDDGSFYVTTSDTQSIFKFTVNQSGTVTAVVALATGLEDMVSNIAVDHAGNVFFIENAYDQPSAKVLGIREITAASIAATASGSATVTGDGTGKAESALPRIDQGFNGIKGLTFDAQGNLYFTSENNTNYGGQVDGVFMIPNEGTPTSPNLVWADTVMVSPVAAGFPVLIDPRGLIYIATGGSGNWGPPGTNAPTCDTTSTQTASATCLYSTIVLWKPGAAVLTSSAVGGAAAVPITAYSVSGTGGTLTLTAKNSFTENQIVTISAGASDPLFPLNGLNFYVSGSGLSSTQFEVSTSAIAAGASGSTSAKATVNGAQTVFYLFSQPETPSKFALAAPSGSNFIATTNPAANTTSTTPVLPCTGGTSYPAFSAVETTSTSYSYCTYYVQLNSAIAGGVEGELQMLDSSNNVIEGSNAYLSGTGQGAAVSAVSAATVTSIASGLNDPRQVAADAWGNTYVADSLLKAIEFYPAGTTSPAAGKAFGTGLTSPTGAAVDGVGDLFIGDSGKVIEIPYVSGALATSQQTSLPLPAGTKIGSHLNLAADGAGDVFVADQDNKQVVEIPNAQTALLLDGQAYPVLGANAGFTAPTAVATDGSGNVWVADGSNLWEISMPYGQANEVITKGLQAPVTGLAVDASGSVYVAGSTGLVWIPYSTSTGTLNINAAVQLATGLGSSNAQLPYGIALDSTADAYATYGSGSTAGLSQLGIGGTINFNEFGEVNPNVPSEVDAQVLNVGNQPLTLATLSGDQITGTGAANFTVVPATLNSPACGPTTNTPPGGSCYLGLVLQSPSAGQTSAAVSVLSNGVNATTSLNFALSGNVIQDLRPATTASIVVTPSTGTVYPGSVKITVTVSAGSGFGTPSGSVTLAVGSANGNLPKQTQTLNSSGAATFTYSSLLGGTYTVNADYGGGGTAGATQNTCSPSGPTCFAGSAAKSTFTVARAVPAYTVGPPVTNTSCLNWTTLTTGTASSNCQPNADFVTSWANNTYVNVANPVWVTASVTSTVGTPTGTVTFELPNGQPADPTQGVNGAIPLNGNGIATFSTENLAKGVYSLTAVYSGDVNYATQTITLGSFEVIAPSVQVTAPSGTVSITAGTPVQATLTLMPLVGFSGNVSLECNSSDAPVAIAPTTPVSTLPSYTECTFGYANTVTGTSPVGKSGPTASTIVVTISTNVPVNGGTSSAVAKVAPWSLAGVFGIGLFGLIVRSKKVSRYLTIACLAVLLGSAFMGITSCTNAGYSTPPPAPKVATPTGTYNVQIITYDPTALQQNSLSTPMFTLPVSVQ